MICPRCGNKAHKDGFRPIIRKGVDRKIQAYVCANKVCRYQWTNEAYEDLLELQKAFDVVFARLRAQYM